MGEDSGEDIWEIYQSLDNPQGYKTFTDLLIDQDFTIDSHVELSSEFELDNGGLALEFLYSDTLWNYIYHEDIIGNKFRAYALELLEDDSPIYFGIIDKYSVVHDKIRNRIILETKNVFDFIMETIGDKVITQSGVVPPTLFSELSVYFTGDLINGVEVDLPEGISQYLNNDDLYTIYSTYAMTVHDFVTELQKALGAYCYVDENRILHFVNRSGLTTGKTATDITNLIVNENFDIYPEEKEYDSVIVNLFYTAWLSWSFYSWLGRPATITNADWGLMFESDGLRVVLLEGNINNVPDNFNYLDLRQKLTYSGGSWTYSTTWKLFDTDTGGEISGYPTDEMWQLYNYFTNTAEILECELKGTALSLFDLVYFGGYTYTIFEIGKNYFNRRTKIKARRILNTDVAQTESEE